MKETFAEMKQSVEKIAKKLASTKHPRANELLRIAQYFGSMDQSSGSTNLGEMNASVQPMASQSDDESLNPGISSFVKMRPGEDMQVDDRKTHTCTVTFKAQDGVSEADMMNYILGIGGELKVDVESFKWSKTEAKPSKAV